MKKIILLLTCIALLFVLASCSTTIPSSEDAEIRMRELGYNVSRSISYGEDVKAIGIRQLTLLSCDKEGDFLQVYYFSNEDDTDTFYEINKNSLRSDVEVFKKNKYSIYRGTKAAAEDFLS